MNAISDNTTLIDSLTALVEAECSARSGKDVVLKAWQDSTISFTDIIPLLGQYIVNPQSVGGYTLEQRREIDKRFTETGRITTFGLKEAAKPARKLENLGQIDLREPSQVEQDRLLNLLDMLNIEHSLSSDELNNKTVDALVKNFLAEYKAKTNDLLQAQAERLDTNRKLVETIKRQNATIAFCRSHFELSDSITINYLVDSDLGDTVSLSTKLTDRDLLRDSLIDNGLNKRFLSETKTTKNVTFSVPVTMIEALQGAN